MDSSPPSLPRWLLERVELRGGLEQKHSVLLRGQSDQDSLGLETARLHLEAASRPCELHSAAGSGVGN